MARRKDLDPAFSTRAMLGAELRRAREKKGLSQGELAALLFISSSYIGLMESGIRRIRQEFGPSLDEALGADGFFTHHTKELAKSTYDDYFEAAAEAEQEATSIKQYVIGLIPGLLQLPEYNETLVRAFDPMVSKERLTELVEQRAARAEIFENPTTPLYWAVLDEAALRRPVGSAETMAKNLRHIAAMARSGRIIIQVMPFSAGAIGVWQGSSKLMYFSDAPPLLYREGDLTGSTSDEPVEIKQHEHLWQLRIANALAPQDSLDLIESVAEDYAHEEQP